MERFIDQRLEQARRQLRAVDLAAGMMVLAVGVLIYTLVISVLDHWVVYGGLGFWGRLVAFGLLVAGGAWFAARVVLPPLVKRINPVFAAYTLELSRPSFKNSLINFLLLRRRRREVPRVIYRALEERAVVDLRQVEIEAAVDRRNVLRLGYVLAGVFAVFCLYVILSPKSPLVSAARLFAPWADIAAPSRVEISNIEPGDTVVFQGDFVAVAAEVRGLRAGEEVLLHYTTADGQSVDQVVPLINEGSNHRHRCNLPPGSRGFEQDWHYRLSAGDALSRWFQIRVEVPPVIEVESVRYDYPAYTGLAPRTVSRQGEVRPQADIRAIEGTRVTIRGLANRPIKRAEIDLGCDGRGSVGMKVEGRSATGSFQLRFSRSDPSRPQYDCYQLRFIDQQGHWNPRPVRYQIDVIADLPPRVDILAPEQDLIRLAPDGVLPIRVRAEDADFALRKVVVRTSHDGQVLPLLARPAPQSPWEGLFEGTAEFRPERLGLRPGQVVTLWAEAEDNKEPTPNVAASARRRIEIIAEGGSPTRAQPADQQGGAQPRPPQPAAQPDSQPGSPPPGQAPGAQPQEPPSVEPGQQRPLEQQPQPGEPGAEPPGGFGQQQPEQGPQGGEAAGASGQPGQGQGQAQPAAAPQAGSSARSQPGQSGDESARPSEPIDPEANPGDAFERILEHRQEQLAQRDQAAREQASSDQAPADQGSSATEQPGAEQSGQQQPGTQQATSEQAGGPQQGTGQQQPGPEPGAEQATGQQPGARPGSQPEKQPASQPRAGPQHPASQPGPEKPSGLEQAESQPASQQQPSGSQPGSQPDTAQRQPASQPEAELGQPQGTGEQQSGSQRGPSSGSQRGPGDQQPAAQPGAGQQQPEAEPGSKPGSQPAAQHGPQQQTGQESGSQPQQASPGGSRPSGGETEGQSPGQPQPSGSGGEPQPQPSSPGQGQPSQGSGGTISPHEGNRERPKTPAEPGHSTQGAERHQPEGSGQSPSTSPRQSDSSSDTGGDRSGGGEQGGGQQAQQPGQGSPGSQSPADEGGGASAGAGQGPVGSQPGDRVPSDHPTGQPSDRQGPDGSGRLTGQPGQGNPPSGSAAERAPDSGQPGRPADQLGEGQPPGSRPGAEPGSHGWGNPTSGGWPGMEPPGEPQPEATAQPGARLDPDLEFVRQQTELALEHLKEQMEKQDSDLFERLGWDREQARRFLEQWEAMRRAAARQGAEGQAAQQRLDEALRSLGLRPRGLQLDGGQSQVQRLPQLRDGGRFEPPAEWSEQVREYLRGIAEGGR